MDNFDINHTIAKHEYPDCQITYDERGIMTVRIYRSKTRSFHYCNNWNHTSPLIAKYKVSLIYDDRDGDYFAVIGGKYDGDGKIVGVQYEANDTDPCVAVATVIAKYIIGTTGEPS